MKEIQLFAYCENPNECREKKCKEGTSLCEHLLINGQIKFPDAPELKEEELKDE